MGDGSLGRDATLDQAGRRRRLDHPFLAAPAGVLRPPHHQDPELGRHDVESLGDVLADAMQLAAAASAGPVLGVDDGLDARQVSREVAAVEPPRRGTFQPLGRCLPVLLLSLRRLALLHLLKAEVELVLVERLRPPAEAVALEGLDHEPQALALRPLGNQHRLERRRIVGKGICRHRHQADSSMFAGALQPQMPG